MTNLETTTPNLPGYTLAHRLGAGGYGEVWLAHAPGGLTKAVKFVYGSHHEKRAEHELKALSKIKEVRHPFLLSVERIEIVEGRLAIVTELADGSLKDRFDECIAQGLCGLPREELLGYLRDAADGLDFLSQRHRLQHLDVKPENLLLVGGHVKVADFGLVKDVGASQASLVGGLTPLYSAPEVFQGAPTNRSDQYSLAILYQEMLTGVMPFAGGSAAELTLQHLHEEPDLTALPLGDRYILARALAKDPQQRYASCTELIQSLGNQHDPAGVWSATPGAERVARPSETPTPLPSKKPGSVTQFFDDQPIVSRGAPSPSMLVEPPNVGVGEPRELAPLDLTDVKFEAQPTLVIGVGGLAADVLRQFRQRIAREFGDEPLPAVRMLLLDSDPKTIAAATHGPPRMALRSEDVVTLPLRRPQEYREQSDRLMRWLSRRWLYNIPRSLRTEGLRPLGRLALADHARQTFQRIRIAIAEATSQEAIEATRERTGLDFRGGAARVIVVAGVNGGAGSGMSLDVGYAARAALDKLGLKSTVVTGVFLHAASGDARRCDLAKVNAYAWLTEYNHFHRPGGQFPGDETCGLPALAPGRRAFDASYLIDLSASGDIDVDTAAAESVADYVYLESLTPAQAFLDECRRPGASAEQGGAYAPLRTFTLERRSGTSEASIEQAAGALARAVVVRWTEEETAAAGAASERDTNPLVAGGAQLVAQLQLKVDSLASRVRGLIEAQFGGDARAFGAALATPENASDRSRTLAEMLSEVDVAFTPPGEHDAGPFVVGRSLEAIASPLTTKLAGDVARWILARLDDRSERLAGAKRAARWLADHLRTIEKDAERLAAAIARQATGFIEAAGRDGRKDARSFDKRVEQAVGYFRCRVDEHAVLGALGAVRRLLAELKNLDGMVTEFGRHLKHLAKNLPGTGSAGGEESDPQSAVDPIHEALLIRLPEYVDAVDGRLQSEFIDMQGGLFQATMGHARVRAQMLSVLGTLAREAVTQLATEPAVLEIALANAAAGAGQMEVTPPGLLKRGGVYRRLVVVPRGGESAASAPPGVTVIASRGSDMFVCCEAWQLPLPAVALDLIQSRRDYAEFAERVHTRSDVAWLPLAAAPAAQAEAFAATAGAAFGATPCPVGS